MLSATFFGADGNPVLWGKQYHREEYTYDADERQVTHAFFGVMREPINGPEGFHKRENQFDENGNTVLVTLSGPDGKKSDKLMMRSVKFTYYPNSNRVESKSALDENNQVIQKVDYDEEGNEIK